MAYALNNPSYMLKTDMNAKTSLAPLTALGSHPCPRKLPTVTKKHKSLPPVLNAHSPLKGEDAKATPSVHERCIRKIPLLQAGPPPHYLKTVVRPPRIPRTIGAPKAPADGPTGAAAYNYYFWSLDNPGVPGKIPTYSTTWHRTLSSALT